MCQFPTAVSDEFLTDLWKCYNVRKNGKVQKIKKMHILLDLEFFLVNVVVPVFTRRKQYFLIVVTIN